MQTTIWSDSERALELDDDDASVVREVLFAKAGVAPSASAEEIVEHLFRAATRDALVDQGRHAKALSAALIAMGAPEIKLWVGSRHKPLGYSAVEITGDQVCVINELAAVRKANERSVVRKADVATLAPSTASDVRAAVSAMVESPPSSPVEASTFAAIRHGTRYRVDRFARDRADALPGYSALLRYFDRWVAQVESRAGRLSGPDFVGRS